MFKLLNRTAKFQERTDLPLETEADIVAQLTDNELFEMISQSSYFLKHCPAQDLSTLPRTTREQLYTDARSYACRSIVKSLYRVDRLKPEINHLHCKRSQFRILARVRTNWEDESIEATADKRDFLSFSILEDQNLSHFPGRVLYGYYSHVSADLIGFISHIDADTRWYAHNRLQLTENYEELLDIDDLLERTRRAQTYCQISLRSKYPDPADPTLLHPLLPDCIISIGKINRDAQEASHRTGLPILLIHPANGVLYQVHDYFRTPELANPTIL